ncbi:MAG TPA: adenylyltransferase [Verrucomicrobiales bacterium]|nr:adenylyltransferase [Verrucomicrobiales bacterium]
MEILSLAGEAATVLTWLSKHIFFPLWEFKDSAHRLQYLKELSASQWCNPEALRQRQWERVRDVIGYAFKHCPFYQTRFAAAGFSGVLADWEDFRRLPLLTKRDIRDHSGNLLSREFRQDDLVETKTGGSTGTALTLYFDKRCQEMRNAAAMRSDHWAGWDIGMKVAAIWGNPPIADTLKKKLRNLLLDRIIYLDTMSIDEGSVHRFLAEWHREQPRIIFGHAHSIYILATYLRRMGREDLRPQGIITTSMMLLEPERQVIETVFGCQVTNRYGCEEVGLIACECERHAGLHLNFDHLVVEFLRGDGTEAEPGEEADIVVTDLINRGMPLIRYRVEDRGVPSNRTCPCGRGLPLMEQIVGRQADFLKRQDGSLVAGVSLVERTLTAISGIEQMQLIQNDLYHVCVKIVKDCNFSEKAEQKLCSELQAVFGEQIIIEIHYVRSLDQTSSGKYRFTICNV